MISKLFFCIEYLKKHVRDMVGFACRRYAPDSSDSLEFLFSSMLRSLHNYTRVNPVTGYSRGSFVPSPEMPHRCI